MARRYPKIVSYIICDDIREEVGNKFSLIGIYRGDVLNLHMPHVLPKLCFHLVLKGVKANDNIEIKLIDPKNKELIKTDPIPALIPKKVKVKLCMLNVMFAGIAINKEGTYRLLCIFGEEERAVQEIKIEIKKSE